MSDRRTAATVITAERESQLVFDQLELRPGDGLLSPEMDALGIPAAMLDKVFNPFFTSKGPGKGTGLGLSMVYGFVKQSAGHIMIYSEEGHGTTIKMYLPPATDTLPAAEATLAPAIEGGNETILVVEDDKLVRDYVLTQLHSLGYVTLDAANAMEALAIVRAGRPFDLLFTDVGRDGIGRADEPDGAAGEDADDVGGEPERVGHDVVHVRVRDLGVKEVVLQARRPDVPAAASWPPSSWGSCSGSTSRCRRR